jgi:hypothetical protein
MSPYLSFWFTASQYNHALIGQFPRHFDAADRAGLLACEGQFIAVERGEPVLIAVSAAGTAAGIDVERHQMVGIAHGVFSKIRNASRIARGDDDHRIVTAGIQEHGALGVRAVGRLAIDRHRDKLPVADQLIPERFRRRLRQRR